LPILDINDKHKVKQYEDFVMASPFGSITQDMRWAKVKSQWDSGQVYVEDGEGNIAAAMSLIFRTVFPGITLAYAPRGPVCDIRNLQLVMKLIDECRPLLEQKHSFTLRIDPDELYDEELCQIYAQAGFVIKNRNCDHAELIQPRHEMVLYLKGRSFEELLPTFSEKTRYNIRLAYRKGVTVRYSRDTADLDTFYEIYRTTCERDKIGWRSLDYFKHMLDAYDGDMLRIYIAESEGEALSAAIALHYGKKLWYLYGASSNEKRNLMPNHAMQAEMIKWAVELGCERYNFGGVYVLNKDNGLFRFKEGFCRESGASELIGEFVFVRNKFFYLFFDRVLPLIRRLRTWIFSKKIKSS